MVSFVTVGGSGLFYRHFKNLVGGVKLIGFKLVLKLHLKPACQKGQVFEVEMTFALGNMSMDENT